MNQRSLFLHTERAMDTVNLLFLLGMLFGGAVLVLSYLVWLAYLLSRLQCAEEGARRGIYVTLALFAAAMITVTLFTRAYLLWTSVLRGSLGAFA